MGGIYAAIEQTSPRHRRGFPPLRNGPPMHRVENVVFKCLYNISLRVWPGTLLLGPPVSLMVTDCKGHRL